MTQAVMQLVQLSTDHIDSAAAWLAEPANHKWLDFGAGRQQLDAVALRFMVQRNLHDLRLFPGDSGEPAGLVGLSDISDTFRTATLWYVLGDKSQGGRGFTSRAAAAMLDIAFDGYNLNCVYAWAVEDNVPSVRVLEKNGFRRVGTIRECHLVDGQLRNRVYFDLLASEYADAREG